MNKLKFPAKHNYSNLITIFILVLIIGIAALLRFYELAKLSFWADEIISARLTSHNLNLLISAILNKDSNMSLFNLLLWPIVHLLPPYYREELRFLPAIFSILSIPVFFLLAKNSVFDRKKANIAGLIAAFFLAINAYHLQYAQELRSYSLAFLLTSLSTYLLIKAIERPRDKFRWIGYAVATIGGFLSHYYAIFIFAAQLFSFFPLFLRSKRQVPKALIISLALIFIVLVPLTILGYEQRNTYLNWIPAPSFNLILTFVSQITGNQGLLLVFLYFLILIIGITTELKKVSRTGSDIDRWKFLLIISCLFLPVFLPLLISVLVKPIFWNRYLLFDIPYLVIFAAIGLTNFINIKNWNAKNYLVVAGLIIFATLSLVGIGNYFNYYQKEDIRGVSSFMSTRCANSFIVYYPFKYMLAFSYYNPSLSSQIIQYSISDDRFRIINFDQKLITNAAKYKKACLVMSTAPFQYRVDDQERVYLQNFFEKKYPNKTKAEFYRFMVYTYSK